MLDLAVHPNKFICNKQALSQFQCIVCYQITSDLYQCKGPCHKPFCKKCISRSKYQKDQCPNRCSPTFQVQPIQDLKIIYSCPYCQQILKTTSDFNLHIDQCQFKPSYMVKQLKNKKQMRCINGHKLCLLTQTLLKQISGEDVNFYNSVMNKCCSLCNNQDLCRSICVECSSSEYLQLYCVDCRQFPVTKSCCSVGHAFKICQNLTYGYVCDLCGVSALMNGNEAYSDFACDICICMICHDKLKDPEEKQSIQHLQKNEDKHPEENQGNIGIQKNLD